MEFETTINQYLTGDSLMEANRPAFPYFTRGSRWVSVAESGWDDWVSGFRTGILWMAGETDREFRDRAHSVCPSVPMGGRGNFNVGFRQQYSAATGYDITGDVTLRKQAHRAVDRLLDCYSPATNLIGHRRNDRLHVSATDAMMNLTLVLWSYRHGYRPVVCRWVAERTLDAAVNHFSRPDGSVHHLLEFDARTGRLLSIGAPQGIPGGCWSRGLAWMATGLILGGLTFNRDDLLTEARSIMNYHDRHSKGGIPPWDYRASEEQPAALDTSAAAILASGMLLLGIDRAEDRWRKKGESIVERLFEEHWRHSDEDGLIDNATFHMPDNTGVREATVWGDFYALEALYLSEKRRLPPQLRWLKAA